MTTRALILAAGLGSRLDDGDGVPKPLRAIGGVPLILRVMNALEKAGVNEIGVVVGYQADRLRSGILAAPHQAKISFFQNDEYQKPNGTSLLKAAAFVTGPTFLLMSDHLWAPSLLRTVRDYKTAPDESLLGVDRRIAACFDLDDATKVKLNGDRIANIAKNLTDYDALDTGVFRITPSLIEALRCVEGPEGCTLSQGVLKLASAGKMRAADVGESPWVDVDTPEAYAHASANLDLFA